MKVVKDLRWSVHQEEVHREEGMEGQKLRLGKLTIEKGEEEE